MAKTPFHHISIPSILEVGKGNISRMGESIAQAGFKKALLYFGEGILELFGETVLKSLQSSGLSILAQWEGLDSDVSRVVEAAYWVPPLTQVIIAVGGGKVIDIARYVAFLNHLPFISIPTSTSNDGFASSGCSLMMRGKRVSVQAQMPFGIIVDIDVVKKAPVKFVYSGIGDLVSKITAVYDWLFEERNHKTVVDDFAVMISKKSVNSVVRMGNSNIRDEWFLKELVDSLTMSGIAMEIAGSSAPASGSEHLISHALDNLAAVPQLHGVQVGVATYLISRIQDHRHERITRFLTETGFFAYAKQLEMKRSDFKEAIDIAPSIKPDRFTCLHQENNRKKAKRMIDEDEILQDILV